MADLGVMQPGPTRAELERREREARERGYLGLMAAVSEPLTYSPNYGISSLASVAQNIGEKGWAKGLMATLANAALGQAAKRGPGMLHMYERAGKKLPIPLEVSSRADRKFYEKTGIFHDVAGNPLQEFSDTGAQPKDALINAINNALARRDYQYSWTGRNKDLVSHPELYARHPELANIPVTVGFRPGKGAYTGSFKPGEIKLNVPGQEGAENSPMSAWLHEMQHAVQTKQGLPRGADPRAIERELAASVTHYSGPEDVMRLKEQIKAAAWKRYMDTEGELGARMTERRAPLSPVERRLMYPFDSQLDRFGKVVPRGSRVLEPYDPKEIDKIARLLLGIPEAP